MLRVALFNIANHLWQRFGPTMIFFARPRNESSNADAIDYHHDEWAALFTYTDAACRQFRWRKRRSENTCLRNHYDESVVGQSLFHVSSAKGLEKLGQQQREKLRLKREQSKLKKDISLLKKEIRKIETNIAIKEDHAKTLRRRRNRLKQRFVEIQYF